jgi:hypothetical protein
MQSYEDGCNNEMRRNEDNFHEKLNARKEKKRFRIENTCAERKACISWNVADPMSQCRTTVALQ